MTFRRMYYEDLRLKVICGYLREPITNGKEIYGECALDERLCKCKTDIAEKCRRFDNFFKIRKV